MNNFFRKLKQRFENYEHSYDEGTFDAIASSLDKIEGSKGKGKFFPFKGRIVLLLLGFIIGSISVFSIYHFNKQKKIKKKATTKIVENKNNESNPSTFNQIEQSSTNTNRKPATEHPRQVKSTEELAKLGRNEAINHLGNPSNHYPLFGRNSINGSSHHQSSNNSNNRERGDFLNYAQYNSLNNQNPPFNLSHLIGFEELNNSKGAYSTKNSGPNKERFLISYNNGQNSEQIFQSKSSPLYNKENSPGKYGERGDKLGNKNPSKTLGITNSNAADNSKSIANNGSRKLSTNQIKPEKNQQKTNTRNSKNDHFSTQNNENSKKEEKTNKTSQKRQLKSGLKNQAQNKRDNYVEIGNGKNNTTQNNEKSGDLIEGNIFSNSIINCYEMNLIRRYPPTLNKDNSNLALLSQTIGITKGLTTENSKLEKEYENYFKPRRFSYSMEIGLLSNTISAITPIFFGPDEGRHHEKSTNYYSANIQYAILNSIEIETGVGYSKCSATIHYNYLEKKSFSDTIITDSLVIVEDSINSDSIIVMDTIVIKDTAIYMTDTMENRYDSKKYRADYLSIPLRVVWAKKINRVTLNLYAGVGVNILIRETKKYFNTYDDSQNPIRKILIKPKPFYLDIQFGTGFSYMINEQFDIFGSFRSMLLGKRRFIEDDKYINKITQAGGAIGVRYRP